MAYNCLVVTAADGAGNTIDSFLIRLPQVGEIYVTADATAINDLLLKGIVDIVFIRVRDWDHRLFMAVHALKKKPAVVFLSRQLEKFTEELLGQVDFHMKEPYDAAHVEWVFRKINKRFKAASFDFIFIKYRRRYVRLDFSSLLYAERINNNYITIHTTSGKYLIAQTLQSLLYKLPEEHFIRVSDRLLIPGSAKEQVKEDGFHFEGRVIPLRHRYQKPPAWLPVAADREK